MIGFKRKTTRALASFCFVMVLLPHLLHAQIEKPGYIQSTGFFMLDGKIYDADGNEFIMRGINHTHTWGDGTDNFNAIRDIARTGANAVRVCFSNWDWQQISNTPEKRRNIVQEYIKNRIVPMVELHEATCGEDPQQIRDIVANWIANKSWLNEFEKYVILNIANEWGPANNLTNYQIWRETYKEAVSQLRANGINNLLVIDASGCGQNPRGLELFGKELIDHDPQHNVALSIHFYGNWRTRDDYNGVSGTNSENSPWGVENELQSMKDQGLPIIAGEFSWGEFSSAPYNTEMIIKFCSEQNIHWLAWSWNSNSDPLLDMVYNWQYRSDDDLRPYGRLIVNHPRYGLRATAVWASIFGPTNTRPQVVLSTPSANDTFEMGADITLTAEASDADGRVTEVSFYRNDRLMGSLNSAPYSLVWSDAARGYHSIYAAARDDSGQIKSTDPIMITVGQRDMTSKALFVVGDTLLNAGDGKVKERLALLGFELQVAEDELVSAEQADGMELVLISSTVNPTRVRNTLTNVAVPIISWENRLFDDLGMTGNKSNIDVGRTSGTMIQIVNDSHPLAAGLSGQVEVHNKIFDMNWAATNDQAIRIASVPGNEEQSLIFAYESGSMMMTIPATARRVGLFFYDGSGPLLTDDGWRLFDAAVDWAIAAPAKVEADNTMPEKLELMQNFPNPFNPITSITILLPRSENVTLAVYSLNGRLVKTLVSGKMAPGTHSFSWDGTDRSEMCVASGVYICRLESESLIKTRKLLYLR